MLLKLTEIEFDFDSEDEMDAYDKDRLASEYIGEVFDVEDGDELVDLITDQSGWCIKSLDYVQIAESY